MIASTFLLGTIFNANAQINSVTLTERSGTYNAGVAGNEFNEITINAGLNIPLQLTIDYQQSGDCGFCVYNGLSGGSNTLTCESGAAGTYTTVIENTPGSSVTAAFITVNGSNNAMSDVVITYAYIDDNMNLETNNLTVKDVATIGSGNITNPHPSTVLRFPATGTAGQQRPYIELQGVYANNSANENGGAFIKFRTSTSIGYGPEIGGIRTTGGAGDFIIRTGGNNVQERFRIRDNGNVGIGVSPSQKLDVNGNIFVRGNLMSATANSYIGTTNLAFVRKGNGTPYFAIGSNNDFRFMVSESASFNDVANSSFAELMRLTRDGDLGLGVENPEHKLDVAGTIRATEILVEAQTADFVFDDDYNLRDLSQIEEFI